MALKGQILNKMAFEKAKYFIKMALKKKGQILIKWL